MNKRDQNYSGRLTRQNFIHTNYAPEFHAKPLDFLQERNRQCYAEWRVKWAKYHKELVSR